MKKKYEVEALFEEIYGEPLKGIRVTVDYTDLAGYVYTLEKNPNVLEYQVFTTKPPKGRVSVREYGSCCGVVPAKWKDSCWFERTGNKKQ